MSVLFPVRELRVCVEIPGAAAWPGTCAPRRTHRPAAALSRPSAPAASSLEEAHPAGQGFATKEPLATHPFPNQQLLLVTLNPDRSQGRYTGGNPV